MARKNSVLHRLHFDIQDPLQLAAAQGRERYDVVNAIHEFWSEGFSSGLNAGVRCALNLQKTGFGARVLLETHPVRCWRDDLSGAEITRHENERMR